MSKRFKYTLSEDDALLAFAKKYGKQYPPTGKKLWRLAETQRITCHSWQSMREKYLLISGSKKPKKNTPPSHPRRPRSTPMTSTLTRPSVQRTLSTSTSTPSTSSTTPTLPRTLFTSTPRRPTTTDASTQTDGTGMVDVGVGMHLFCPVTQYRPVDVGTQTVRQPPQHRRSCSF